MKITKVTYEQFENTTLAVLGGGVGLAIYLNSYYFMNPVFMV